MVMGRSGWDDGEGVSAGTMVEGGALGLLMGVDRSWEEGFGLYGFDGS